MWALQAQAPIQRKLNIFQKYFELGKSNISNEAYKTKKWGHILQLQMWIRQIPTTFRNLKYLSKPSIGVLRPKSEWNVSTDRTHNLKNFTAKTFSKSVTNISAKEKF